MPHDSPLRALPAVHVVLAAEPLRALADWFRAETLRNAVRQALAELRQQLQHHRGATPPEVPTAEAIARQVAERLRPNARPQFRRVLNATGIVLHTNLGRSPLSDAAIQAVQMAARGYLNLELDLATGKRSSRQNPLRSILAELTGAESATAVNNCAAATVLVLRALAAGKEVIVSRGQLIEIGGSFRIPEIMAVSGAILREVGTTNITRISDYERAIGPNTALLLRVHWSNYRIRGFTRSATLAELVELGRRYRLPVIDDVGSGALLDLSRHGLPGEPVVGDSVRTGADLVLFSGDKLLGGPQAGVIVGRQALIQRLEKDPLMRAFRLDKMTLSALEATLQAYRSEATAFRELPTLRMLTTPLSELRHRAEAIAAAVQGFDGLAGITLREASAYVGGGSLPELALPSMVIALRPAAMSESTLADRLRNGEPSVLARIQAGEVLLDPRTLLPGQDAELISAIRAACRVTNAPEASPTIGKSFSTAPKLLPAEAEPLLTDAEPLLAEAESLPTATEPLPAEAESFDFRPPSDTQ